jgi:hypothetical protein
MAYESKELREGLRRQGCIGTVRVIPLFKPIFPLCPFAADYALRNTASAGFSVSVE